MSGLNARFFPTPFPFLNALQRTPAGWRAEALQRTSPLTCESFVTARPVARMIEKNLL